MDMVPTGGVEIDLVENAAGKVVGADSLVCRGGADGPPKCGVTISLPAGNVFASATGTSSGAAGTVVGGTGHYTGIRGTIVAKNLTQTKTRITLTFG